MSKEMKETKNAEIVEMDATATRIEELEKENEALKAANAELYQKLVAIAQQIETIRYIFQSRPVEQ